MNASLPPPEAPITPQDWAQTPPAIRALLVSLWGEHQALPLLRTELDQLHREVAQLKEKVGKHSQNSSQPPSSDGPAAPPRPKQAPSGRKPGAQKGHPRHQRKLKPRQAVQRVVAYKPDRCGQCGALLLGDDLAPQRRQVSEIPKPQSLVVEYQRHTLTCLVCGAQTQAPWGTDLPTGAFGPRTQAMVSYLGGRFGLSDRDIEELMAVGFDTQLSLGSVPAQEQAVSAALAQPVEAARSYVQTQPAVNMDETGWQELAKPVWLWVGATPWVTVFLLIATRSAQGMQTLLGDTFAGILGSDRWSAYNGLDPLRRQVCWAHLKRDFQALVDRGGESQIVGQLLLKQVNAIFTLWHRLRAGSLSRMEFQQAIQPIQMEVKSLLEIGTFVDHRTTRTTCRHILKLESALWTFVNQEGVEPTNNSAERPLRRGVLWRKRSFGTQSQAGSLFVERILTAVMTLRQQNRDVLDFLTCACQARNSGVHPPSLLPLSNR